MDFGWTEGLALAGIILSSVYVYLTWHFNYWKNIGVPGPKPWPFLGNMAGFMRKPMFQVDVDYMKKYGKVFGVFEGRNPSLFVSDLEMLKHIFVKDFNYFMDRRTFDMSKVDETFNHVLTALQGEEWKSARSILSPAFTSGKLKAMTELLGKSGASLASNMEKKAEADESMEMKEMFGCFTLDVIASCGFGIELNSLEDPNNPFVLHARTINNFNMFWLLVLSMFPVLLKYFRVPFMDFKAIDFFKQTAIEILEARKKSKERRADFVQLMIEAEAPGEEEPNQSQSTATTKQRTKFLTNEMIVGQSIQFFLAGFETVSVTLAFTAYCLALNPGHQEKLVQEIDEAIEKHGDVTYDAVASMSYLDMVVTETMRLYPAAFRTERKCVQDYTYENITIPKGTMVAMPVYAIHHNEENYPDPEEFRPERFSSENKGKIHSMAYLPFGAGPRNCIGLRFALLEMKVALVQILRRVTFVTCPETEIPLTFSVRKPALYPANGIRLKTQKRN